MDCQWQEGGDALSGSDRNSLVIWWSPQRLIKLCELFSEKTSKKQKLLSLTTWRVYNVKGNFAYLESLKTVNPPSPLQTTALPQTHGAQNGVQTILCKAVNSYWGNIIVQISQNYFGTSDSEVNNLKHMRGTELFRGSMLCIFRKLGLLEFVVLSGVWAYKVMNHFSKCSLFDEPGLIWSQSDGYCDKGLQRLNRGDGHILGMT